MNGSCKTFLKRKIFRVLAGSFGYGKVFREKFIFLGLRDE
jgi:hypothetical protein